MSEQNSNVAQKEPSPSRRSYDFSRELRIASRSEASTQRVAVRFNKPYHQLIQSYHRQVPESSRIAPALAA